MRHLTQFGKFLLVALLNLMMELNTIMNLEEDFLVIARPLTPSGVIEFSGSMGRISGAPSLAPG